MSKYYIIRRLAVFSVIWLSVMAGAVAQRIGGRVTDPTTKQGIAGVSVIAVGTNIGATTDAGGNYSFLVKQAGTYRVRFSAIGSETKEVQVTVEAGGTATANAQLVD